MEWRGGSADERELPGNKEVWPDAFHLSISPINTRADALSFSWNLPDRRFGKKKKKKNARLRLSDPPPRSHSRLQEKKTDEATGLPFE